jgi:hypothetical protein
VTAATIKGAISALPDNRFDAAEAVEHIRAYLAKGNDLQQPAGPTASETFAAEATRLRTILRRVVSHDTIRNAATENPEEVRAFVTELRELLDQVEKGIK